MFSRLLVSIRESITRTSNGRAGSNRNTDYSSDFSCDSRRPSVSEELLHNNADDNSVLSKFSTNQSVPVRIMERNKSVTEPIPIVGSVASATTGVNGGRRGSLFGISNVTYDDYVQKDLISTSWS